MCGERRGRKKGPRLKKKNNNIEHTRNTANEALGGSDELLELVVGHTVLDLEENYPDCQLLLLSSSK
jgi:hypothetical protein